MRAAQLPRMMIAVMVAATLGSVGACAHDEHAGGYLVPVGGGAPMPVTLVSGDPGSRTALPSRAAHVQVLPEKRPSRPAEVVGVVDAHVDMGEHDRALAVLREKAAALGADAVIGVDLQHGEGHKGEPIHLSGLAIRYLDASSAVRPAE